MCALREQLRACMRVGSRINEMCYSLCPKKLVNLTFQCEISGSVKLHMYPSYILIRTHQNSKAIELSRVFLDFPIACGASLLVGSLHPRFTFILR